MMQKKFQNNRVMVVMACIVLNACATFKTPQHSTRAVEGLPQYWLTTSMYAAKKPTGPIILAPSFMPSTHIIKAGTLVQITGLSRLQKQFLVHLRVAKERGQVSIFCESEHVLKVPEHINTKTKLKSYLNNFLSKNDPHVWLLQSRNYIQEAIWQKQPAVGMSKRELLASMGPALKKQSQKNPDTQGVQEIWHYFDYFVVVDEQQVSKVKKLNTNFGLAKK